MKNQVEIQQRFLKEDARMQLGHLASDLSRIASLMDIKMEEETVKSVMEEAKFFAEWAGRATDAALGNQMLLTEIQGFIAQKELEWDLAWKNEEWRVGLQRQLRLWAQELLKRGGFLDHNE